MVWYLRLRCQHAEDGGIDVIFGDAANIHKLLQRVLIGYIAGVFQMSREKHGRAENQSNERSVPGNDIKRRVILFAREQPSSKSVHRELAASLVHFLS